MVTIFFTIRDTSCLVILNQLYYKSYFMCKRYCLSNTIISIRYYISNFFFYLFFYFCSLNFNAILSWILQYTYLPSSFNEITMMNFIMTIVFTNYIIMDFIVRLIYQNCYTYSPFLFLSIL